MKQPELLADILKAGRRSVPDNEFCIELKMRVFEDTKLTVELARRAEHVGIGLISIHGRTHSERDDPVRAQTIKVRFSFEVLGWFQYNLTNISQNKNRLTINRSNLNLISITILRNFFISIASVQTKLRLSGRRIETFLCYVPFFRSKEQVFCPYSTSIDTTHQIYLS